MNIDSSVSIGKIRKHIFTDTNHNKWNYLKYPTDMETIFSVLACLALV